MDLHKVGLQIRALRICHGLTQADLAEAAGLSVPYISHIERGRKTVSLGSLLRIADALNVNINQLLIDLRQSSDAIECQPALQSLFADCSFQEQSIILDIAIAVKQSLRNHVSL